MVKCNCYQVEEIVWTKTDGSIHHVETKTICNGTRERDECSCGGDRLKCSFYPEVRLKAAKEIGVSLHDSILTSMSNNTNADSEEIINLKSKITELEKKVKELTIQNKNLKKSNRTWQRKVQRLRNHENEYETKEAEIEGLLFRLNRLGYSPEKFKKELEITRQFIIDHDLLYELASYNKNN